MGTVRIDMIPTSNDRAMELSLFRRVTSRYRLPSHRTKMDPWKAYQVSVSYLNISTKKTQIIHSADYTDISHVAEDILFEGAPIDEKGTSSCQNSSRTTQKGLRNTRRTSTATNHLPWPTTRSAMTWASNSAPYAATSHHRARP